VSSLEATPPGPAAQPPREPSRPESDGQPVESVSYTGRVTDHESGEPIEGVTVAIERQLSRDPETGEWRTIETTQHRTNAQGEYSFTLPPEQVAEESLYLVVDAHHPQYASKGRSGYSHTMIRKNLALGEQPFYSHIQLWPGEAIVGQVVSPEGEPLQDVEVLMYSISAKSTDRFPRGSFDKTKTDAEGNFRIVPATPGDGVLWIEPEQFAPEAHRIGDRRGDWGQLKMQPGARASGRVLDAKGESVASVKVEARRQGDGEEADEFLGNNAVANHIGRTTTTGPEGKFTLGPLPDGDYVITVQPAGDYEPSLEHVFLRRQVSIADGKAPDDLEIRAVPHVYIHATYLNSEGQPRSGHEVSLFGRMDGEFFFTRSTRPGDDGKLELKLPHGLQEVELDLSTNEHSSLRWRKSPDAPLQNGRRVELGTVEEDISGIEIIRYVAPIVLVKAVDENGAAIEDFKPKAEYEKDSPREPGGMFVTGVGGDVYFEPQRDGRWRSSHVLPDQAMTVTAEKEGYTTMPQELSLPEGEERELVFVLRKEQ
jgi:hypothetical protein